MLLRLSVRAALGCRAADGSRFGQDALTAAHKTLPFGTRVRVTCAATGRSIVVRTTDRGPFIAGRAIDLSWHGPSACRV
ncbi:rare lipoprotein A [Methylobacterium sp. ME121]|nr:rare lipoprotein A [Methylobacterium sp. ME121]